MNDHYLKIKTVHAYKDFKQNLGFLLIFMF